MFLKWTNLGILLTVHRFMSAVIARGNDKNIGQSSEWWRNSHHEIGFSLYVIFVVHHWSNGIHIWHMTHVQGHQIKISKIAKLFFKPPCRVPKSLVTLKIGKNYHFTHINIFVKNPFSWHMYKNQTNF